MLKNYRLSYRAIRWICLLALILTGIPALAQIAALATPEVTPTATQLPTEPFLSDAPTPTPTPLPPLRDDTMWQDTSLLVTASCALPCWNGITPGETFWSDELDIIENDPRAVNLTTRADDQSEAEVAEWQRIDGVACCQMVTLDGEIVNLMFLRLAPGFITVGDLIEARGEPSYVVGSSYSDEEAIINLVYPELSTVVYIFVAGESEGALSASSEVIGLLYFDPDDMDLLLQTSNLNAWEGYQTYRYYEESGFEIITPDVTLTPTPRP